jgi:hypothetical protein
MRALYRWRNPTNIELQTVVEAKTDLARFEVFVASYFDEAFTNALVYLKEAPGRGGKPGFLSASPVLGDWLMSPRDASVIPLITDGRWGLEPHPVEWVLLPPFELAVAARRAPASGLTAVLASPRDHCIAVSMPQELEGHYSLYFSLLGRDLHAGESARGQVRLVVGENLTDEKMASYGVTPKPGGPQ